MLVRQSANIPFTSKCLFTLWCTVTPPGWLVSQQQNNVVFINSYTGENHSVHTTFINLTYVRPHKKMGGNLANWSMADHYNHPWWFKIFISQLPMYDLDQFIEIESQIFADLANHYNGHQQNLLDSLLNWHISAVP